MCQYCDAALDKAKMDAHPTQRELKQDALVASSSRIRPLPWSCLAEPAGGGSGRAGHGIARTELKLLAQPTRIRSIMAVM